MSMRGEKIWIRIFIHFLPLRNKALFLVYYQKAIQSDAQLRKFMLKSKKVHVKLPCFRKFLSALHHFCHRWFFKGTNWKVKSLRTCPEKGARITDAGSMATLFFPKVPVTNSEGLAEMMRGFWTEWDTLRIKLIHRSPLKSDLFNNVCFYFWQDLNMGPALNSEVKLKLFLLYWPWPPRNITFL